MRTHTEKTAGQAVKEALAFHAPLCYAIPLGGRSPSMGELRGQAGMG